MMWGPWEGGMVSPALAAMFAEGISTLSEEKGCGIFMREISLPEKKETVLSWRETSQLSKASETSKRRNFHLPKYMWML